ILGLMGMPRRVYTYLPEMEWGGLNLLATVGGFLMGLGVLLLVANLWACSLFGRPAEDNPWSADTLEWATSSPPPNYNFALPPVVSGRHPLWEERSPVAEDGDPALAW